VPTNTSLLRIRSDAVKPFSIVWISHMLVEIFLLMHPALVPVFMKEFNLSIFQAGLIITVPNVIRLFFILPTGIFADRFGPRRLVILSMLVSGSAALLVSQSTTTSILVLSLSLIMISVTLYHPPGLSIISNLFDDPRERSTAIGLHGASGCIGQSVGTISIGLLLIQFGWRFCYLLYAVPLLAWTAMLAKTKIPQQPRKPAEDPKNPADANARNNSQSARKSSFVTIGFATLMLTMALNALANGSVSSFMTTYMTSQEGLTFEIASIIYGAGPLVGIGGSLFGGHLSSRLGDKTALMLTYIGQVTFLLGLITIPSIHLAMTSFLFYQMFSAALWTPASSLVANLVHRSKGGKAYSLYFLSGDAAGAVAPTVAATLITSFNIITPFIFAIALLASNALLVRLISTKQLA
jgi:MFS family permease